MLTKGTNIRWLLLAACLTLVACAPTKSGTQVGAGGQTLRSDSAKDSQGDLNEGIALSETDSSSFETAQAQYFDGTGEFYVAEKNSAQPISRSEEGGVNLQFRDTDVRTVLDAVLVDTLGVTYQLDPTLKGTLSLETSGPVSEEGLLFILESVLQAKSMALVEVAEGYRIMPIADAPRGSRLRTEIPASQSLPGFAVQIVPLKYTAPSEMRKVLEPFAPRGGIVASDDARNLLILAGTGQEMSSMLDAIETFDVDWMAGMSFAMFHLQYVESEALAKELLQIFGDAESPIAGSVRFIPIPRLNRLLVLSAQPNYLREVESWIERLDLGGSAPGRRIYVYHVQNGRATDLAQSLNAILGGDSGEGSNPLSTSSNDRNGRAERSDFANANSGSRVGGLAGSQQNSSARQSSSFGRSSSGAAGSAESPNSQASGSQALGTDSIRIVPSEENNSLLILAAPSEFGVIEAALKQMDEAPRQVLIEASLAEVTLNDELRYGVQWFFDSSDGQVTLSEATGGGVSAAFPGFSYVFTGSSNARAVLNALESVTDVNVISSPKLLVLNNQSATLQVGDEVPVPTQSSVSTSDSNAPIVNSVEYRNTGVILSVTPRINEGGLIYLDVIQEVSDVVETTSSGIDAPTIQQRKIESTVAVQDGATIALGGLIRETDSVTKAGVPVLQRIPLLGNAFRRTSLVNRRTELVILLTPRVMRDAQETTDVLDYLRDTFKNVEQAWQP